MSDFIEFLKKNASNKPLKVAGDDDEDTKDEKKKKKKKSTIICMSPLNSFNSSLLRFIVTKLIYWPVLCDFISRFISAQRYYQVSVYIMVHAAQLQ